MKSATLWVLEIKPIRGRVWYAYDYSHLRRDVLESRRYFNGGEQGFECRIVKYERVQP